MADFVLASKNSGSPFADMRGAHVAIRTPSPIATLRGRGVTIVTEPFVLPAISRKLAFFCDPFGNLIELAEVLP